MAEDDDNINDIRGSGITNRRESLEDLTHWLSINGGSNSDMRMLKRVMRRRRGKGVFKTFGKKLFQIGKRIGKEVFNKVKNDPQGAYDFATSLIKKDSDGRRRIGSKLFSKGKELLQDPDFQQKAIRTLRSGTGSSTRKIDPTGLWFDTNAFIDTVD